MKKVVLTMLMLVMFSMPCLAQVETNNTWSAHGTLWQVLGKDYSMGFYNLGDTSVFVSYGSSWPGGFEGFLPLFGKYTDLGFITLVSSSFPDPFNIEIDGYILPLFGVGVVSAKIDYTLVIIPEINNAENNGEGIHEEGIWILYKVGTNWTPPGLE